MNKKKLSGYENRKRKLAKESGIEKQWGNIIKYFKLTETETQEEISPDITFSINNSNNHPPIFTKNLMKMKLVHQQC